MNKRAIRFLFITFVLFETLGRALKRLYWIKYLTIMVVLLIRQIIYADTHSILIYGWR